MKNPVFASLMALFLVSCAAAQSAPPTALLVVGNSISRHGPDPTIDWNGDWGMAASGQDKDFAHLTAAALNLPLTIENGGSTERDPAAGSAVLLDKLSAEVTPQTLVILELGDNVQPVNLNAFAPAYGQLAQIGSKGSSLICLSTYWTNPHTDQVLRSACRAHRGTFVSIGDIFPSTENPDYQGPPAFARPGVQRHPHDWSMQQIADRVIAAARRTGQ
jgi:hypothetical protein